MSQRLSQKKPFLAAARDGDFDTVVRLLDEGVPVDVYSRNKTTALIRAAGEGHEQIVKLLLDRGADINACNDLGFDETPLTRAAEKGRLSIVTTLLAAGASVNGSSRSTTHAWSTPLEKALLNNHLDVAHLLRQRGADPNLPMGTVVWKQRLDLVDTLLKMGADINEGTSYGRTPLMRAASGGDVEIVLALIARGADPELCSRSGETALGEALRRGNFSAVEALIQNGARCQFVNEAVCMDDFEGVKHLLKEGADPNDARPFRDGLNGLRRPLFHAVDKQNADIVMLLLDHGADPNFEAPYTTASPRPKSLLSSAQEKADPQIVDALLKAGAVSSWPGLPPQLTRGMG